MGIDEPDLGRLAGERLAGRSLVVLAGPQNRVGARYFRVFLDWGDGLLARPALLLGLLGRGYLPAYNWLEVSNLAPQVSRSDVGAIHESPLRVAPAGAAPADSEVQLVLEPEPQGGAADLFRLLARLVPPGGHLMVEYDSPFGRSTAQALDAGVPPAATPLGHLMFLAGCGDGFKDWAIAEGWTEGPRKLQGYRALDEDHRRAAWQRMAADLQEFLGRTPLVRAPSPTVLAGRRRAEAMLASLRRSVALSP